MQGEALHLAHESPKTEGFGLRSNNFKGYALEIITTRPKNKGEALVFRPHPTIFIAHVRVALDFPIFCTALNLTQSVRFSASAKY